VESEEGKRQKDLAEGPSLLLKGQAARLPGGGELKKNAKTLQVLFQK